MPAQDPDAVIVAAKAAAATAVSAAVQEQASRVSKRCRQVRKPNAISTGVIAIAE